MKHRIALPAAALFAAALLAGCGGGGGGGDAGPVGQPTVATAPRATGTLLEAPVRSAALSTTALKAQLLGGPIRDQLLLTLAGDPVCDIEVRSLRYTTSGGAGEESDATGALMTPGGSDPRCSGARPILLYAHATHAEKTFNFAALTDRLNPAATESLTVAALFAARGYIVVAPNYAGYDRSTLGYHPFLNAQQQSADMLDALTAARTALAALAPRVATSSQLFVTGYSQGGHVALATLRALEAAGTVVTAAAPMSGPYALARELDDNFAGQVHVGSTLFASLLATSYQRSYGTVYGRASELYESGYVDGIDTLLPGAGFAALTRSGRLPASALFSPVAPRAPADAPPGLQATLNGWTPPHGTGMDRIFARGFGADHLFTNSFRLAYLQDMLARPADPAFGLRVAARRNDLRGFTPRTPVLLCGGGRDATVSFANTLALAQAWAGAGSSRSLLLDVGDEAPLARNDPFLLEKSGFALLREATAVQAVLEGEDPEWEVARNYHAAVFPFCASAVGKYFSQF